MFQFLQRDVFMCFYVYLLFFHVYVRHSATLHCIASECHQNETLANNLSECTP